MDLCISNREQLLNEYLIPLSKISDNAVFKVQPGKIVTTIATSDKKKSGCSVTVLTRR
jgi:hypothetical protein